MLQRRRDWARRFGWKRLAGVAGMLAATGACEFGMSDDGGGGGCGGTPGVLGNVTFNFEQAGVEDLSDPSGNAFATGTVEAAGYLMTDGEAPPSLVAESSDGAVFSVGTGGTAEHPLQLTFLRSGIANLRLLQLPDRTLLDEVALRVADPRAIRLTVGHGLSPSFDGGGLLGEPERIVLLPGAECRLYAYLTDGTERILFGVFTPAAAGGANVSVTPEGMVPLSLIGQPVHAALRIRALAEGSDAVTLEGPLGLQREVVVEVTATPVIERLELALWPGYLTEWEVGQSTFVSVFGRAEGDGAPVYGTPAQFASSDETVVTLRPGLTPDSASLDFIAVGEATISVRLVGDPAVSGEVHVTVVPPDDAV